MMSGITGWQSMKMTYGCNFWLLSNYFDVIYLQISINEAIILQDIWERGGGGEKKSSDTMSKVLTLEERQWHLDMAYIKALVSGMTK